jgi:hypothetical protein
LAWSEVWREVLELVGGGGCEDEVLGEEVFDFVGVGHVAHFVSDLTDGRVVDLWLDCQI